MNIEKFDRQIRLFGLKTQERLCDLTVQVFGGTSFIPCEISKNVVLLGIKKLVLEPDILLRTKQLIPDGLEEINDQLQLEVSEKIVGSDVLFIVDGEREYPSQNLYSVCSKCFLIQKNKVLHTCSPRDTVNNGGNSSLGPLAVMALAEECLVGAFAVQEFIKSIEGVGSSGNSFKVSFAPT